MVRLAQITFSFSRFLGEDMATIGVAALVFAGSCFSETLSCRPVGLDFILGHLGWFLIGLIF